MILLNLIKPTTTRISYADETYGQIISSSDIYRSSNLEDSVTNIICSLEPSYYVKIIMDYSQDAYKVMYFNEMGYVKKSVIKQVFGTPITPYPSNIYISINKKCYFRSSPIVSKSNTLSILDINTQINYIGTANGDEVMDLNGNIWYYCSYENITGYVYSGYTDGVSSIMPNLEQLSFIKNVDNLDTLNPLSDTSCILLIIVILIPVLLMLYMLYRPNKKKRI